MCRDLHSSNGRSNKLCKSERLKPPFAHHCMVLQPVLYSDSWKSIKTACQGWSMAATSSTLYSFPEATNFLFRRQDRERSLGAWSPVLHNLNWSSQRLILEEFRGTCPCGYRRLADIAPWYIAKIFSTASCSLGTSTCCWGYRGDGGTREVHLCARTLW